MVTFEYVIFSTWFPSSSNMKFEISNSSSKLDFEGDEVGGRTEGSSMDFSTLVASETE